MISQYNEIRTIIAVDLDYFFAQCEEVRNPGIKGKPVVVCVFSGRSEDSGAVSTANYVARRYGVKSGIPIISAKRILKDVHEAVFLPIDKEYYDLVSDRIMEILHSYARKFEKVSIDEAFLDVTAETNGDFDRALEIARKIKKDVLETERLTCSVGIAPNKLLAKMAADSKKPDGVALVRPKEIPEFMNELPVGKLFGVGPKIEKRMNSLGVRTIGDLAGFDEKVLSDEFGAKLGPQLRNSARGLDEEPVEEREREQLSRIVTLKKDAERFEFQDSIKPLAFDISERLVSAGLVCKSVGIIAITTDLKQRNRSRTLEKTTNSETEIMSIVVELFNSYFAESMAGAPHVRRAGIRVSDLSRFKESVRVGNPTLTDFL